MSNSHLSGGKLSTRSADLSVDMFDNEALSDVQIKLRDGERIFAHKQILAQKSDWFFRAFNGDFPVCWRRKFESAK